MRNVYVIDQPFGLDTNKAPINGMGPGIFKQGIIIIIAMITIILIYQLGISLGMSDTIHLRHTLYSIPGAIGFLNHGGTGYTVYSQLTDLIGSGQADINSLISQAIHFKNLDHQKIFLIPSDDKGTIDFAVGSFVVFGSKIQSLYKGYFLLLIVSATVYFLQFRKRESELIYLTLFLLSLFTMTRVFPLTKELFSFHNPRVFGTLAIIPVMHLCFLMLGNLRPTIGTLTGAFLQVFLLVEVIHVRSTEIWIFFPILMLGMMLTVNNIKSIFRLWPVVLLIFGFILLNIYQHVAYNSEYFKTKGQNHIFWHNVGIGLSLDPKIARDYDLSLDDLPMVNLVRRHAMEVGGKPLVNKIFGENGSVNGIADNFKLYESTARDIIFEIIKKNPAEILYLQFWIKPKLLVMNTLWAAGLYPDNYEELKIAGQIGSITSPQNRIQNGLYFNPLNWYVLTCLILLALAFPTASLTAGILLTICQLGASLLPDFVTYPLIHTLAVPLDLFAFSIELITLVVIRKFLVFAVLLFKKKTSNNLFLDVDAQKMDL